jgi:hypothetical protein
MKILLLGYWVELDKSIRLASSFLKTFTLSIQVFKSVIKDLAKILIFIHRQLHK